MPTKITMPQLGESVSEGTVGRWLKNEGDAVKRDEVLVEIVTDKVTAEYPSPVTGRLVKILAKEDETVKVGAEIAEIEEASAGASASSTTATSSSTAAPSGASMPSATPAPASTVSTVSTASAPPTAALNPAPAAYGATNGGGAPRDVAVQEKVSPLARRLAQEHNVDLSAIQGTGEGGRVRKEDILAYVEQRDARPAAVAPAPPAPSIAPAVGDELVTPSPARRAIAEHMVRSKHTSPHAYTLVEVDVTGLSRWLDRNKDEFKRREGYGISFQTFVIKAVVEALKEHPYLNASWTDEGKILLRKQIAIGISIALENNLIVPVIKNADTLNLAGIAAPSTISSHVRAPTG